MKNLVIREYDRNLDKDWLDFPFRVIGKIEKMKGNKVLFINSEYPLKDVDLLACLFGYKVQRILSVISSRMAFVIATQE